MESVLQRLYDKTVEPVQPTAGETRDPKALRRAGNHLCRRDDVEKTIEKYKETIAAGSEGGMQASGKNMA